MNKIEKILHAIVSLMITAILYLTYTGYLNGAYEQNPIARFIFETIYNYTNSWAISILIFIPIVIIGLYVAVVLIKRDYKNKPRAGQVFLTTLILLITPNTISIVFNLMWDNSFIAPAGAVLAVAYLIYEWFRPKIIKTKK